MRGKSNLNQCIAKANFRVQLSYRIGSPRNVNLHAEEINALVHFVFSSLMNNWYK
jgi:hypothetical protein